MIVPSWLQWARTQIGTKEIVGPRHNPAVVDYWRQGKVQLDVKDDETAWCAAFVAAALESTGYRSTRSGLARSYERDRTRLIDCDERLGAIVVFSSAAGPTNGHVGFLDAVGDGSVYVLGGNQGNQVSVAPFKRSRLIRVCWPAEAQDFKLYPLAPQGGGGTAVSDR